MEFGNTSTVGKFLDPVAIISQLDLKHGCYAADFGCGPGYFSIPFAQRIGESGLVYSFDILPQALETVEGKKKNLGISNIITKRANLERVNGTKLEPSILDWVILKDVLFQNKNRELMIEEAFRVLKPGGKAIVVEWNKNDLTIGPDEMLRIDEDELKRIFQMKKFSIEKEVNAGDFHYAFVAVKI